MLQRLPPLPGKLGISPLLTLLTLSSLHRNLHCLLRNRHGIPWARLWHAYPSTLLSLLSYLSFVLLPFSSFGRHGMAGPAGRANRQTTQALLASGTTPLPDFSCFLPSLFPFPAHLPCLPVHLSISTRHIMAFSFPQRLREKPILWCLKLVCCHTHATGGMKLLHTHLCRTSRQWEENACRKGGTLPVCHFYAFSLHLWFFFLFTPPDPSPIPPLSTLHSHTAPSPQTKQKACSFAFAFHVGA